MAYLSKYDKKTTSVISKIGKKLISTLSKVNKLLIGSLTLTIKNLFGIGAGLHISVNESNDIYSIGYNGEGQLGDGTFESSNQVYKKLNRNCSTIIDYKFNGSNGMYLTDKGIVFGWGNNASGSIGTNTTTSKSIPYFAKLNYKNRCYNKIDNNVGLSAVIDNNGQAFAWGAGTNGELGDNTVATKSSPVAVCMGGRTFCQITVGDFIMVALDQNGQAFAWGLGTSGQLGNNAATTRSSPVAVCMGGRTFCKISSGVGFTIALDQNGQGWAWGVGTIGQLGDNTTTTKSSPVAVCMGGRTFCQIYTGEYFAIALDQNGQGFAWGAGDYGTLGNEVGVYRSSPIAVCMGGRTFCKLAVPKNTGGSHVLALSNDNKLYAWGNNQYGQLGVGIGGLAHPYTYQMREVKFDTTVSIKHIGTSAEQSSIVTSDDKIYIWGYASTDFRSGVRNNVNIISPERLWQSIRSFNQITGTDPNAYGLDIDGKIWGWGTGTVVSLGDNSMNTYYSPIKICHEQIKFCQIVGSSSLMHGLTQYGQVFSWGNTYTGDNSSTSYSSPGAVCMGGRTFCQISSRNDNILALDQNGQAFGWGSNAYNQLGRNNGLKAFSPVAVCMGGRTFCKISLGGSHAISLDQNGQAFAWGLNTSGQLGDNTITNQSSPVAVCMGDRTFCQIFGGGTFVLTLDQNGQAFAWGSNLYGQLGINSLTSYSSPIAVCMGGRTFCQISASAEHVLAIDQNGQLFVWGRNNYGQLGINSLTSYSSPVSACMGGRTFCHIHAGEGYSLAIDNNKQIFSWGSNSSTGRLGTGNLTDYSSPIAVLNNCNISVICDIAVNTTAGYGLSSDGQIWSWGINTSSLQGYNSSYISEFPIPICIGNRTICKLINNNNIQLSNMFALDINGQAFGWGVGTNGELGDNTVTTKSSPVAVCMGGRTFCQIVATKHALVIDQNGQAFAWGSNVSGILGDNTMTTRSSPIAVCMGGRTFCQISAGQEYSLVLDQNGQAFAWGLGTTGQLGDNTLTTKSSPVAVCMGGRTFCQITSGLTHNLALDQNGQAFAWGNGAQGQLGDNTLTTKSSPVAVCMGGRTFCKIFTLYNTNIAVDSLGDLYFWGSNTNDNSLSEIYRSINSPVKINSQYNKTFTKIKGMLYNACGLTSSGQVWVWGSHNSTNSLLGLGEYRHCLVKPKLATYINSPITVCNIEVGAIHNLLTDSENNIWAWGKAGLPNVTTANSPYLGNNETLDGIVIQRVCTCGIKVKSNLFSAGVSNSAYITTFDQPFSWGLGTSGANGDNSTTARSIPFAVCFNQTTCLTNIKLGNLFSIGLDNNGQGFAWGINSSGTLGDNSTTARSSPVAVCMGGRTFCLISSGYIHSISLDQNGQAFAWGSNSSGMLGDNTVATKSSPVAVCMGGRTFCQIILSDLSSIGLDQNGQAFAWGNGYWGQLGDNNNISLSAFSSPIAVCMGGRTFCKILPITKYTFGNGVDGYLAISNDNKYFVWGGNLDGTVPSSYLTPYYIHYPTKMCSYCAITTIVGSENTNYINLTTMRTGYLNALTTDGKILQWGMVRNTFVSSPTILDTANRTYCQIVQNGPTQDISTIALDKDGQAFAWGVATSGVLGNMNTSNYQSSPIAVCMAGRTFCQISGGAAHNLALDQNGQAFAWGLATNGRLGDQTTATKSSPVAVCMGGRTFCQISAGQLHSLALDQNGQGWCWGTNSSGQLGRNTTTSICSPVAVCMGGRTFCQISAGYTHSAALDQNGQAFAWGLGTTGGLGDNTLTTKSSPVAVCMGGRTFCKIYAGSQYTVAIDNLGQIFAWGSNLDGNLGQGNLTNTCSPVAVCIPNKTFCSVYITKLTTSLRKNTLAITNDGETWFWGCNEGSYFYYEGRPNYSTSPIEVSFCLT